MAFDTVGRPTGCPLLFLVLASVAALGALKTDIVVFHNGYRLTGEVKGLDRGQLRFSTDAGPGKLRVAPQDGGEAREFAFTDVVRMDPIDQGSLFGTGSTAI